VLQGLEQSSLTTTAVELERGDPSPAPVPDRPPLTAERGEPTALAIDPAAGDAPLEVLVVDALWKLAQLRDAGLLHPDEVAVLRSQLLARVTGRAPEAGPDGPAGCGPLLRV
jgi:hypothetical protein